MTITVSEEINAPASVSGTSSPILIHGRTLFPASLSIEVINRPKAGIVGLKYKEKRILFGKDAVETMWISAAEPNSWYETMAENH